MDAKHREDGRDREDARARDEEAPRSKSLAKKTGHFEPPRPVEGAFGQEERDTKVETHAERAPESQWRGRGGTGVGRDLDH